jgi:hypothetical protein
MGKMISFPLTNRWLNAAFLLVTCVAQQGFLTFSFYADAELPKIMHILIWMWNWIGGSMLSVN